MTLFETPGASVPEPPRRRMPRGVVAGIWALVVALVALLTMSFLPSPYVIERPGPVYNTLGTVTDADGNDVSLIAIDGAETYPTEGALDLLTVQVIGSPEQRLSWLDAAVAWFDPTKAVVPIEQIFPTGQTSEQRSEQNTALMVDSQADATAAALTHLGYDVHPQLQVAAVADGSPASGQLQVGDRVLQANGTAVTTTDGLRRVINDGAGAPIDILVDRGGTEQNVTVTPQQGAGDASGVWQIGISLTVSYTFPFDVQVQLNNVGGPSAGMMFALGMIDQLTPGELNGGEQVAGTGTISADGEVGPIGGIRQKLWGAHDAGAEYFLAPESNCDEVVGHVPDGLRVFSVSTLDDAVNVLDAISSHADLDALPTCT